jgi:hypothetical protein
VSLIRSLSVRLLCLTVASCSPSVEDQVQDLAAGAASENTRQALLLAKERAVGPLLGALDGPLEAGVRTQVARILAALMMRTEDKRIEPTLVRLLRHDPDPTVRASVAKQFGMHGRTSFLPALLAATEDSVALVRQEALIALGSMQNRWLDHEDKILTAAQALTHDDHLGTRVEALIVTSVGVQKRLQGARNASLAGDLVGAESLMVAALAFAPGDKRAAYDLGRLYLDKGDTVNGQQVMRRHGLLMDVPRLRAAPAIDGVPDEPVWQDAAHTDSLWLISRDHEAALPTDIRTDLYVGWRVDGLYIAMVAWDPEPADLVIGLQQDDDDTRGSWIEDRLEIFLDPTLSRSRFVQLCINPEGTITDGSLPSEDEFAWDAEGTWASHVEDDRWSTEVFLRFTEDMSRPEPGQMWGANLVRCFRGQEFIMWVRTSNNSIQPHQFGTLVFR